ncbi:unnamed protein product [Parascedosporium putredinis]|uniref:Uncharacterized protein n=1 Tax=Parascedosporium putredinis TaxID=1442378 RepID=A0A9P1MFG2_9PEZI|nr:unnamed protein product [Parascedosporium putredinis]CAI8003386.1 unnamed protein product [Parascedosporium putredinis]
MESHRGDGRRRTHGHITTLSTHFFPFRGPASPETPLTSSPVEMDDCERSPERPSSGSPKRMARTASLRVPLLRSSTSDALSGVGSGLYLKQKLRNRPSLSQLVDRVRSSSSSSITPVGYQVQSTILTIGKPHRSNLSKEVSEEDLLISPTSVLSLSSSSQSSESEQSPSNPAWDRTLDVVYHQYPRGTYDPDTSMRYRRSVTLFRREHNRPRKRSLRGYLTLPHEVRLLIWQHVLADINSSSTQPEPSSLTSYLEASFDVRADAMVCFLMTRRFHVIHNPYVGPALNPLATKWLDKYGPYMQHLTFELDLTRNGFSSTPNAQLLRPGTSNLEDRIRRFVSSQKKRSSASTMSIEYCPNHFLRICDPLIALHGLIDSIRICGFSKPYTLSLLKSIFPTQHTPSSVTATNGGGIFREETVEELPSASRPRALYGSYQLPAPRADVPVPESTASETEDGSDELVDGDSETASLISAPSQVGTELDDYFAFAELLQKNVELKRLALCSLEEEMI